MEITIAYLDEDNIQKSKGKKDVLGATHIWGTKKFKKGPDGWHYVKDADNKERGDDRPNTVCDLDDGDGWRPGPKNLVGKFYQKGGKKWKVVSADLKAGTARCTTGLGKSYESKTADLKELAGEDFEKSVFDEFEPTSNDIEKGVKANIGEIRIWGGKRVRKQSNGKWVEVSEQGLSKKEHENMNFYHDKESNRWRNVEGKNDLRVSHDERKFEHKELASKLSDKEYDESALDIEKSVHKYFKREGTPGNYRYYYTEEQYKQAKSGVDKFEIGDIVRIKDGFVSKKTDPLVGLDLKIIKNPQGFYQDPIFRVENVSKKGNGVEIEELHADNLVKYEPKKKDD